MRVLAILLLFSSAAHAQSPSPDPRLITSHGAVADCLIDGAGHIVSGTDAGPAIQATIAAVQGFGEVLIPHGRFCMRTPVSYVGGRLRFDAGQGGELYVYTPGQNAFQFTSAERVTFDNMVILGDTSTSDDVANLFKFTGDGIYTIDHTDIYGLFAYSLTDNSSMANAPSGTLIWHDSRCFGCADYPYGAVVSGYGNVHVDGARFQDYGSYAGIYYDKESQHGNEAWVLCGGTSVAGNFGAPGEQECTIRGAHFDEGAQFTIWAFSRQNVVVSDSTFLAPAFGNAGFNIQDVAQFTMERDQIATRTGWQAPAVWLTRVGIADLIDVWGHTVDGNFLETGLPSQLQIYDGAYDVTRIYQHGGAIGSYAVSPYTLVTVDGVSTRTVQAQKAGTWSNTPAPSPSPIWSDGFNWYALSGSVVP